MALPSGFASNAARLVVFLDESFQRNFGDGFDAVEDGAASYSFAHPHSVVVCRKCYYIVHGYVGVGVVNYSFPCQLNFGVQLYFAADSFGEDHDHLNVDRSWRRHSSYLFLADLNFVVACGVRTRPKKSVNMYASAI